MLIKCQKIPFNCGINTGNLLRIMYSNDSNIFNVFACCAYEYDSSKILGTITRDDIYNNRVYDKLIEIRENNKFKTLPIQKDCFFLNHQICEKPVNNYICQWNKKPLEIVEVCISKSCNLTCKMCRDKLINEPDIDDLYYKILYQLKGHNLKKIWLTEKGEPFFHKKQCLTYLNSLTENDVKNVEIISNITLLNDKDIDILNNIEKTNNIKINIHASIDSFNEETYKKIRKNNLFNKVMKNAKKLAKYNLLYQVNFVVQQDNIDEIFYAYEYVINVLHAKFNAIPIAIDHDINSIIQDKRYIEFLKYRINN